MTAATPLFAWLADWWRQGTYTTIGNTTLDCTAAGVRTAVSEPKAAPIGSGRFSMVLRYSATTEVPIEVFATRFFGENGTGSKGDLPKVTKTVPATTGVSTVVIDLYFSPGSQGKSFRPVVTFRAPIVVEEIQFYPRIEDTDVEEGELADGRIRSFDTLGGVGPSRPGRLSASSEAGDTAVLSVTSSWPGSGYQPPAGWTFQAEATIGATGRSGYVATRLVKDPSDTQQVNPWGPRENWTGTARDNAALVVVKGTFDPKIIGWSANQPALPAPGQEGEYLLMSQFHGAASVADEAWTAGSNYQIVAGGASKKGAWSSTRIQRVTDVLHLPPGGNTPQGWAGVHLRTGDSGPRFSVWDAVTSKEIRPASVKPMPIGARTVAELFAVKNFVIAHRGGSGSWPEHSLFAYTQAVAHGVDALEVSCHQTTDGVWVASHDDDMRLILQDSAHVQITKSSWADLQTRKLKGGHPVMRLEQLIEAYGNSHTLFVDPKSGGRNWRALPSTLKQDNVVLKFSGDATWLAREWRQAGAKTWGYMYPDTVADGRAKAWAADWDYVGMSWDASQQVWDTVKGWGKPVIAHIIPNAIAYEQAVGKGAVGCMVAGVKDVKPEGV